MHVSYISIATALRKGLANISSILDHKTKISNEITINEICLTYLIRIFYVVIFGKLL